MRNCCAGRKLTRPIKGGDFCPCMVCFMEVTPEEYQAFYQEHNHQNYIQRLSIKNGDISYDMLTNEEQNGANILVDSAPDIVEQVEKRIMLDKLRTSLALLSEEELQMLISLFYLEMTERDLAREYQISQVAIHKRKQRILEKLKKLLEIDFSGYQPLAFTMKSEGLFLCLPSSFENRIAIRQVHSHCFVMSISHVSGCAMICRKKTTRHHRKKKSIWSLVCSFQQRARNSWL